MIEISQDYKFYIILPCGDGSNSIFDVLLDRSAYCLYTKPVGKTSWYHLDIDKLTTALTIPGRFLGDWKELWIGCHKSKDGGQEFLVVTQWIVRMVRFVHVVFFANAELKKAAKHGYNGITGIFQITCSISKRIWCHSSCLFGMAWMRTFVPPKSS